MDVLARLALAQAARLARSGEYGAAEALLGETALAGGPRADVLDLRARIRAQQERWAEAQALWKEAQALDPENSYVRAALAALERPSSGRRHLLTVASRALALLAVLLLVWTVVAQRREIRRFATAPAAFAAGDTAKAEPPPEPASGIGTDLLLLDSLEAALAPLAGVTLVRRKGELEVRFPEGLFTEGITFRSGGQALVARVAESLMPTAGRVDAKIVGHTDSVPLRGGSTYSGNVALGFARATIVADILLGAGATLWSHTAAMSAADASPPYEGQAPEDARRNRSVTLLLAPTR